MKTELLIAFGSWEERFALGMRASLRDFDIGEVLGFYFEEYRDRTNSNRALVSRSFSEQGITANFLPLSSATPERNWISVVREVVGGVERTGMRRALVDISTMPREIIWYICWALTTRGISARYVYYSPKTYGKDWLSRDPRAPRLVYKLGGVSRPDRRTALLVTMGFDRDRPRRLVRWLEPESLLFGVQVDSEFERNQKAMEEYRDVLRQDYECEVFELDAFAEDRGRCAIEEALGGLVDTHNVVLASLGPKLTAISLFQIHQHCESTSLAYAPANQFSDDYSSGIGPRYMGNIGSVDEPGHQP